MHTQHDKIACVIFCKIKNLYVVISCKNTIACKVVQSPPKEIINDKIVVLSIGKISREQTDKQPFVISKNPFIIPVAIF